MAIKAAQHNVEWPGQIQPSSGLPQKWDSLREELDKLYVGGRAVAIIFDEYDDVPDAQATVSSYGRKQNCEAAGWRYMTTRRGSTLYIQKVAMRRK
jgi:hypothetical protein